MLYLQAAVVVADLAPVAAAAPPSRSKGIDRIIKR
jgi:hypothetical protein